VPAKRRCQLCVAADRRRADQLRTLAVLLCPGVPDDHEHRHQPDAMMVQMPTSFISHRAERGMVEAVARP
jgi:hypothetical protein